MGDAPRGLSEAHLRQMQKRPGMFGLDGHFASYVAYLTGWADGNGDSRLFHVDLKTWLCERYDRNSTTTGSLGWSDLIMQEFHGIESRATQELFECVIEFLAGESGDRGPDVA